MKYHLNIQPFDFECDFLDEIGWNAKSLYKIETVSVLPRKTLSPSLLLSPKSLLAKFFMRKRKMIYLDDLLKELEKYLTNDLQTIFLAILPHYVLGFGENLVGLTPKLNLSIVSTYGINKKYLSEASLGISLHEIGHNLGLKHCRNKGCLMKTPCKPKNFYDDVYKLCKKHEKKINRRMEMSKQPVL